MASVLVLCRNVSAASVRFSVDQPLSAQVVDLPESNKESGLENSLTRAHNLVEFLYPSSASCGCLQPCSKRSSRLALG